MRQTLVLLVILLLAAPHAYAGWDEGVAAFQAGQFREAEAEFRSFVEKSPEAAQGHYMLGLALQGQKRPREAVPPLKKAIELDGEDVRYRLALGQTQLYSGAADAAVLTLAAVDPGALPMKRVASYGQLLARAAVKGSRGKAALQALERAAEADPKGRHLWIAVAQMARRLDRVETELAARRTAFELDPKDTTPLEIAYSRTFELAEAAPDAERAGWYRRGFEFARLWAQASPESAAPLLAAGAALQGAQAYDEAGEWFEKAVEVEPGNVQAIYDLGRCELADGRAEPALAHFEAALQAAASELRPEILLSKGSALRHLEEFEKAAVVYGEAGAPGKVAEMEKLAQLKTDLEAWERERVKCQRKAKELAQIREDSKDLHGTRDWEEMEAEIASILAPCEPYLKE